MKGPRYILLFAVMLALCSCKKDPAGNNGMDPFHISEDIIYFDTLFTTTGSVTQYFKIYNDSKRTIRLPGITLAGGAASLFKINVDGVAGPSVSNAEIEGKDSLYVFVSVKIDPQSGNLPFLVEDSIGIEMADGTRWIQLQAWGQDANFIRSGLITGRKIWTKTKPYVIIGALQIEEGAELIIDKGARIFLHADAALIVDGMLRAKGEKYDSTHIIFTGDRLDEGYKEYPGAWPGIFFRESSVNNLLSFVEIRNAYQGIVTSGPTLNNFPKLTMESCIVTNCYDAGIIGRSSDMKLSNTLISNCGKNILLLQGGNYSFTHCTDVAVSNAYILHKQPVLALTDYFKIGDQLLVGDMKAEFINCIFWGQNSVVEDEVVADREAAGIFDVSFINCLWKMKTIPPDFISEAMILNQDPLFVSSGSPETPDNFRLTESSPVNNTGKAAGILTDLDGNPRDPSNPDPGAYESGF